MGTIDEIIKVIDDKLIENGKEYISLGNANQLLAEKKIINIIEKNNKTFKKLLEENKIPHAYQTEDTPKQWRIPLSDDGKKRIKTIKIKTTPKPISQTYNAYQNQQINQTICPGCGINLFIPDEILSEKYIQCLSCRKTFRNPLNISKNEITGTNKIKGNWLIAFFVFVFFLILGNVVLDDNTVSNGKVQNSYLDASVSQVKRYLKDNLLDPDSYESIEWSAVNEMSGNGDYKYWVRHKYRARNTYGGYVIENKIFYIDSNGKVINDKDVY